VHHRRVKDVEALREAIEEEGAVRVSRFPKSADLAGVTESLAKLGIERSEKHFRRPLKEQIREVVAAEDAVPRKGLRKRLAGVESADELEYAISEVVGSGDVAVVATAAGVHLVRGADAVCEAEMRRLEELSTSLRELLRVSTRSKLPLRRADVDAVFDAAGIARPTSTSLREQVLEHVLGSRQLLVSIPELVRALDAPAADVHDVLNGAAEDGIVELRPASSVGALEAKDASLCPRTPDGVLIHYVRPLQR